MPPPTGDPAAPLQALIIDSWFDNYVGVVMLVRVVQRARCSRKDKILLMATGAAHLCEQVGVFTPKAVGRERALRRRGRLRHRRHQGAARGQGRRHDHALRRRPAAGALPGFKEIKPQVFAGLYPVESNQYEALRDALEKLQAQRRVAALRAGGLAGARLRLPLRLPRPAAHGHRAGAARARVRHGPDHDRADGGLRGAAARRHRAARSRTRRSCPTSSQIEEIREPIITVTIFVPQDYVGPVMTLCTEKRGMQKNMQYLGAAGDAAPTSCR